MSIPTNIVFASMIALSAGIFATPWAVVAADLPDVRPRIAPVTAPPLAPQTGLYFATRSAITVPDATSFSALATGRVETEYEIGSMSGGALGYRFAAVMMFTPRVEVEGSFGRFSVDKQTIGGIQQDSVDSFGSLQAVTGFVSGYADLNLAQTFTGWLSAIRPYIGGGVGAAHVTLRKQGASATGVLIDNSDTQFAYHLSAGIGIELSQFGFVPTSFIRNSTLEIGYRRLHVPELSFTARDGTVEKTDLSANMVTIGFRRPF